MTFPPHALSVRQPWAWAIIHAGKDIENRVWGRERRDAWVRGLIAVHASKGMTRAEYEEARWFMATNCNVECPPAKDLVRGAIIGSVEIVNFIGSVPKPTSPWFMGPRGLVLRGAQPCNPIPCSGQLGFFKWREADASVMPPPARWMLAEGHV